ncbi:MAG: glutamate--tRNA ligase family protein [Planctomycetota bacterium]|nr:glutamate--tRNA ligase family protein [Planctomycetota bacterium]
MLPRTTRLAPSPTGDLHLGNARSLLLCWALARSEGWKVILRIEDLDGSRCDPRWEQRIIAGMRWLGLDWDGPVRRQSEDRERYAEAMRTFDVEDRIFTCPRTRRELQAAAEAAGAPHESGRNTVSTAEMRPEDPGRFTFAPGSGNHRLKIEPGTVRVRDLLTGEHDFDLASRFGDPIVWTRDDRPAYQLAVVVDDLEQGITDVVRGIDLLPSAGLQQEIAKLLGGGLPKWWHLPLLLDPEGRRLAKRDGDDTLGAFQEQGIPPERVIGLLARTCEMQEDAKPMSAREFVEGFDVEHFRKWVRRSAAAGGDRLRATDTTDLMEDP